MRTKNVKTKRAAAGALRTPKVADKLHVDRSACEAMEREMRRRLDLSGHDAAAAFNIMFGAVSAGAAHDGIMLTNPTV